MIENQPANAIILKSSEGNPNVSAEFQHQLGCQPVSLFWTPQTSDESRGGGSYLLTLPFQQRLSSHFKGTQCRISPFAMPHFIRSCRPIPIITRPLTIKYQRLMDGQTVSKDYSSVRRHYPQSALGEYFNPTISSSNKARSRSSSQKSKLTRRPFSKYETNNPTSEIRQQAELSYPKDAYRHIIVMVEELKRGVAIVLNNQKQQVYMKVYQDHIDIQQNSVNQTLNLQPISPNIRKAKVSFGEWSKDPFSVRVRSLEGKINPNHVFTDSTVLFQSDLITIEPFLMIQQAELLRKRMLLRMNSKKTTLQEPLKEIAQSDNQLRVKECQLNRKSSLKLGIGFGAKPNHMVQSKHQQPSRKPSQNLFPQVQSQIKKIPSTIIQRQSSKCTFKKLREEPKIPATQKSHLQYPSMTTSQVRCVKK